MKNIDCSSSNNDDIKLDKLDLITVDEINAILEKYRITKRNLSLVVGLGELTITRYLENGNIPTKKNSDLLKRVLDSPFDYRQLLIENKDKIKPNAYNKSKNCVDELLNLNTNDTFIEDVAEYIIYNNKETTNLLLQKLLYYTELFNMVFFDKSLYESQCGRWKYGPVYGRIYYEYKDYESNVIELEELNVNLNDNQKKLIDSIIKSFGCYSGKVLSFFTHHEIPWEKSNETGYKMIDKDIMLDYARYIRNEYKIASYSDISKYSDLMFELYKASN